jgi:hypothetical protein
VVFSSNESDFFSLQPAAKSTAAARHKAARMDDLLEINYL